MAQLHQEKCACCRDVLHIGKTNIKCGLERKIAQALGEREAAQKEINHIQAGLQRLIGLREKVREQQAHCGGAGFLDRMPS